MNEEQIKQRRSLVNYLIVFFVGCLAMYAVVYLFPTSVTKNVTKLEKDVTVTDTGIADAVEKVYNAVVIVSTYKDDAYIASGTGFVYKKDGNKYYILTNHHVIDGGNKVTITFTDGRVVETKVVGSDQYSDIAVLSMESKDELTVASLGKNDNSRVGDTTFAVGAPLDSAYSWTVTRGILSGKDRLVEVSLNNSRNNDYIMKVLQTDAAINSGNSGGALLNSEGKKMGKTVSGAVWLDPNKTSPFEFYQYWRNVADADVLKCIRMLTFLPLEEIDKMDSWEGSQLNQAKEILAYELTKLVHGEEEAVKAQESARALFSKGVAADMPSVTLTADDFKDGAIDIVSVLVKSGLVTSRNEGRRAVEQGGVAVDGEKIADVQITIPEEKFDGEGVVVRRGKKNFRKVSK